MNYSLLWPITVPPPITLSATLLLSAVILTGTDVQGVEADFTGQKSRRVVGLVGLVGLVTAAHVGGDAAVVDVDEGLGGDGVEQEGEVGDLLLDGQTGSNLLAGAGLAGIEDVGDEGLELGLQRDTGVIRGGGRE